LATILKNAGHDVNVIEESIKKVDVTKVDSDVVCLSMLTWNAKRGYELASQIKKLNPKTKVIIGGMHASMMPEEAIKYADTVVVGEGESVIKDVIDGKIVDKIVKAGHFNNLNDLPFPDFSLVDEFKPDIYPISTSRGCPCDCNFCSVVAVFGRRYRFRNVDNVINELVGIKPKNLYIYDDNFCALKDRAKEILRKIYANGIKLDFLFINSRLDIAHDEELMNLLSKPKISVLEAGIESINPVTLKNFNKEQKITDIEHCVKTLKDYGIILYTGFVIGSDSDNNETIKNTLDFCIKNDIDFPSFHILTPFPGTKIYQELESEKRIFTKDWNMYDLYRCVFYPKNFTPYELQMRVLNMWKEFYSMKRNLSKLLRESIIKTVFRFKLNRIIKNTVKQSKDFSEELERVSRNR